MRADRFRPTRAGLIGLYQYADQIFCFEEGRLALRGRNTSGKSKVLELVVPFVLDGDISPRKLDPFAKDARDMHWNLIGATDKFPDARSDQRFGYAWLEFWHPDRNEWLTAIIGLKANRADSEVKRRYFVTDQRVGINLMLCEHAAGRVTPVGLDTAIARIAAGGDTFSKQATYKTCLRERLVGFDSAETMRRCCASFASCASRSSPRSSRRTPSRRCSTAPCRASTRHRSASSATASKA